MTLKDWERAFKKADRLAGKKKTPVERKLAGASLTPRRPERGTTNATLEPARADVPILGTKTLDGQMLRAWRLRVNLSQDDLAHLLDVPQSTISRWETGSIEIMHPRILALALVSLARALAIADHELEEGRGCFSPDSDVN